VARKTTEATMHYVDQAIGQFCKRLASISTVKGGHVKHCVQVLRH